MNNTSQEKKIKLYCQIKRYLPPSYNDIKITNKDSIKIIIVTRCLTDKHEKCKQKYINSFNKIHIKCKCECHKSSEFVPFKQIYIRPIKPNNNKTLNKCSLCKKIKKDGIKFIEKIILEDENVISICWKCRNKLDEDYVDNQNNNSKDNNLNKSFLGENIILPDICSCGHESKEHNNNCKVNGCTCLGFSP